MSRELLLAELQRRGAQEERIPTGSPLPMSQPIPASIAPASNREAILAELQRRGVPLPAAPAPAAVQPQEPGFLERTGEKLQERGVQMGDILQATFRGEQTLPEGFLQGLGTQIGAVGDIVGEGIISGITALPEQVKEPVISGFKDFLNTDIGRGGLNALSAGAESWEKFKAENPRAARNLEAGFNVGASFIPLKGTEKGVKIAQKAATRTPVVTSDAIKALASDAYKRADELGGVLKPEVTNKFIAEVEGLTPQTEIGRLIGGDNPLTTTVKKLQLLRDKPISLAASQEVDEALGDAIDGFVEMGRLTKDGKKLLDVQNKFRNAIERAPASAISGGKEGFEALKEGRKLWAASRKLSDVERILTRAELIDNPATAIKTGFRTIVSNPSRLRGFTKKEVSLMKKAAKTGIFPDILRMTLGSRLIPIFTTASGGGLGATALATASSISARGAANKAAISRAQDVSREIARRAVQTTKP